MAAALKQSFEKGDMSGALLAHKQLTELLKLKAELEEGTTADTPAAEAPLAEKGPIIDSASESDKALEPIAGSSKIGSESTGVPTSEAQPPEAKHVEAPAGESDALEAQPVEAMAVEAQPVEAKAVEAQAIETKAAEAQAMESRSPEAQPLEPPGAEPATPEPVVAVPSAEVPQVVPAPAATPAVSAESIEVKPVPPAPEQVTAAAEPERYATFYDILGVDPLSPFEKIRVQYLKLVTHLIRQRERSKEMTVWVFRDRLRTLCVAYDVLRDPNTRTDYDFRLMGLRGDSAAPTPDMPEDVQSATSPGRPHLRIGELLQCSEILEPNELDIAVDMHKAMPEMAFGQFLVTQGFLTDAELHSALLGQHLISDGKITVAQFQIGMYGVRESSTPISETLVSRGWVDASDISSITIAEPAQRGIPFGGTKASQQIHEVPVQPQDANGRKISLTNALPSWANNIDWEESTEQPPAADAGDAAAVAPVESKAEPLAAPAAESESGAVPDATDTREAQAEPAPPADEAASQSEKLEEPPEQEPLGDDETGDSELDSEAEDSQPDNEAEDTGDLPENSIARTADIQAESQSPDSRKSPASYGDLALDEEAPVVGSLEETSEPEPPDEPEPPAVASPPVVPNASSIGRDPVVRALQEKLAAIKNKSEEIEDIDDDDPDEVESGPAVIIGTFDDEPEAKRDDAAALGEREEVKEDEPVTESLEEESTS